MHIPGWDRVSILKKISFLILVITVLVIGYSVFVYTGYITIKVNGPVYTDIISGKDLIADILPPPGYILEPFQISLEMFEEDNSTEINKSIATLYELRSSYVSWYEQEIQTLQSGEIKDRIHESNDAATKFWDVLDSQYIPAIRARDHEKARKIMDESLKIHYQEHRDSINRIVILVKEENQRNEQLAVNKEQFIYLGMIGIAVLLFITLIAVELILIHMLRPLKTTTLMIQEMSRGHLSGRMHLARSDEIGQMANAMDSLADYLQETFEGLTRIAHGNLSGSFREKDDTDQIAPVFNHLIEEINDIMNEVRCLITEAEEGNLRKRGDPNRFNGIYREIIDGINNMLDAFIIPLNEALRVADEFSYAHFSTRFDERVEVKGDLIALKEGLNAIGEELSVVRYKLSLLSSITRHDILNQITVVKSGLDVIEDDFSPDDPNSSVLALIRSAVSNIREQINFTAIYEQMGVQQPIWHQVSDIILKSRNSLNLGKVIIQDDTEDLEIFADQMFGQVIFNLADNAIRHGKSLTAIHFSFEISGDEGLLIMSDNGIGIANEDKGRIFQKGFGKNTGLGLFLIKEILAFTHITIKENGEMGSGARFEIRIPPGKWRINRHHTQSEKLNRQKPQGSNY